MNIPDEEYQTLLKALNRCEKLSKKETTMTGTNCPLCGGENLEVVHGTFHFNPPPIIPGGTMIITNATWQHCNTCNEDILSHELDQAIDRERYRRLGLLTPEEIRKVREKTGKSAVHMSHALGVGEKTYTRWENGRSLQTKAMAMVRLVGADETEFNAAEIARKALEEGE